MPVPTVCVYLISAMKCENRSFRTTKTSHAVPVHLKLLPYRVEVVVATFACIIDRMSGPCSDTTAAGHSGCTTSRSPCSMSSPGKLSQDRMQCSTERQLKPARCLTQPLSRPRIIKTFNRAGLRETTKLLPERGPASSTTCCSECRVAPKVAAHVPVGQ